MIPMQSRSKLRDQGPFPEEFDFKDVELLQRFLTPQHRIQSAKRSGLSAGQQRSLKRAIKLARFLALLPYTS
ncbi:MAG: 30S ribosomal protein S18 [Planctomycetota bacterium]